jgi:cyclophilin family peptidyl-prolyl cis-trans isomerase
VAGAAADAIAKWTGRRPDVAARIRAGIAASELDFSRRQVVEVELANGRSFHLGFFDDQAPLTRARFLELVEKKYYDGLTFHRIVPNFVVQGGSPNANEYCGDCPFMRDEVGLEMHVRGTLGISTRGRDTGDAQIFVNLVDNPRLDHEYTVFAYVCRGGMSVVDAMAEGERVNRIRLAPIRQCDR